MYLKDKKVRLTLRLSSKQFVYVKYNAEAMDIAPSEFLRQIINMAIVQLEREGNGIEWDKLYQKYLPEIEANSK